MAFCSNRRFAWSAIILVVLTLVFVPVSRKLLFEKHLFSLVDEQATAYVDEGLVRAGVAFATARTFNAVVSVFQESELQLEPGGVGVSLALGAALDPVNDLVERFSWVMLASLTSLGVQKVLIEITPFVSVQIILVLALLSLLAGLWLPENMRHNFLQLGRILLFCALLLRFAVPAMTYLNQQVYTAFLQERQSASIQALGQTASRMEAYKLNGVVDAPEAVQDQAGSAEEQDWWNRTKSMLNQTFDQGKQLLDVREKLEAIQTAALGMIDRIVDLIVVFVLSTIALPLLFLWGIFRLGKLVVDRGLSLL